MPLRLIKQDGDIMERVFKSQFWLLGGGQLDEKTSREAIAIIQSSDNVKQEQGDASGIGNNGVTYL